MPTEQDIRKILMKDSWTAVDVDAFVFEHYRTWWDTIKQYNGKAAKMEALINYCRRSNQTEDCVRKLRNL